MSGSVICFRNIGFLLDVYSTTEITLDSLTYKCNGFFSMLYCLNADNISICNPLSVQHLLCAHFPAHD